MTDSKKRAAVSNEMCDLQAHRKTKKPVQQADKSHKALILIA